MVLAKMLEATGLDFVTEFRFDPSRRWAFDWAYPPAKIAVEFEGGTYSGGGHVRGRGFSRNCEKYNAGACAGWAILRYTSDMIRADKMGVIHDLHKLGVVI